MYQVNHIVPGKSYCTCAETDPLLMMRPPFKIQNSPFKIQSPLPFSIQNSSSVSIQNASFEIHNSHHRSLGLHNLERFLRAHESAGCVHVPRPRVRNLLNISGRVEIMGIAGESWKLRGKSWRFALRFVSTTPFLNFDVQNRGSSLGKEPHHVPNKTP